MPKLSPLIYVLVFAAGLAQAAPPVVTSSEETAASICLDFERPDNVLLEACVQALQEGGLGRSNRAEVLSHLSYLYLDRREFDLAEEHALKALELRPDDAEQFSSLGWIYWEQDRIDEARAQFERSIELHPQADALAGLANILRIHDDQSEKALEMLQAALAINPEYSWGLRELGWAQLAEGAVPEAEKAFRDALAVNEWDGNAYRGLARALDKSDRRDEAIAALNRSMNFGGDKDVYLRVERARLLRMSGRPGAAVKDAVAAVKLMPSFEWGYVEHARSLNELGKLGAAIDVLKQSIEAGAAKNSSYYWLADLLSDDDKFAEALVAIDKAIEINNTYAADHELRAYIAINLNDNHAALSAANEAVRLSPDTSAFAHFYAALAELAFKEPDKALARFDQAMATGLPDSMIGEFAAEMISGGYFMQAIKLRSRY